MKSTIRRLVSWILFVCAVPVFSQSLPAQGTFYGGGIGVVGSFELLNLTDWPQETILFNNVAPSVTNNDPYSALLGSQNAGFTQNSTLMYGVQGFGQVTEHIRLSGTAIFGSKTTSTYYDPSAIPAQTRSITVKLVKSVLNTEYLWRLGRNAQVGAGVGVGLGRISLTVLQHTGDITWERVWLPFGTGNYSNPSIGELGIHSTTASAVFVITQPIISFQYQLMTWVGLRVTGGFQIAQVGQDAWKLNGTQDIAGAEAMSMMTPFLRGVLYFGI